MGRFAPARPVAPRSTTWSWKLVEISGITVSVHATFVLLVAWFAYVTWLEVGSLARVASSVALLLLLFACVLLHELGHALTAQRFGIVTRQITLLPIGGIARLETLPTHPAHELWITLAGPMVNVVIAAALFIILKASGEWQPIGQMRLTEGPFLERLMVVNVSLVAFNLLPAFPMDGGRVLRALLALRTDPLRATRIAARLGQQLAVVFGIIGIATNPMLAVIALFVWFGATQEARMAEIRAALSGVPVDQVMTTEFRTLAPDDPLAAAVELVLHGLQHEFPVIQDGRIAGVLTRGGLLRGLAAAGPQLPVSAAMERDIHTVTPHETLETVFGRLEAAGWSMAPVVDDGRLAGVLTADAVADYLRIRAALEARP